MWWKTRAEGLAAALFVTYIGMGNAVLSYFADMWEPSEMLRHAAIGAVLFDTGIVFCFVILAWDYPPGRTLFLSYFIFSKGHRPVQ